MQTAIEQRADMRAAGAIEPACEQIQALVERIAREHGEPGAHELGEFLMALAADLEQWTPETQ